MHLGIGDITEATQHELGATLHCLDRVSSLTKSRYGFARVVNDLRRADRLSGSGRAQLWAKRATWALAIVNAPSTTAEDVLRKMLCIKALLDDGEVVVALTPQVLGECSFVLNDKADSPNRAEVADPELWQLRNEIRDRIAAIDATSSPRTVVKDSRALGAHDCEGGFSARGLNQLHGLVRRATSHQTKSPSGLKVKGEVFQTLVGAFGSAGRVSALQLSYVEDFVRLVGVRLFGAE